MSAPKMVVPLVDLRAGYHAIRDELLREFDGVLEQMQLRLGPNIQRLEQEFSRYCGAAFGVAVSNGTDALYAALAALGIGPGDEVILPSHTFIATAAAVIRAGAVPVFVDVEPDTLTIDPVCAAAAVGPATRAILPVHLYGHPADMDPLLALAREHDLKLIEDAAQAHGARYHGRRCGGMGDAACFSFYFTKNLGAYGEGGFVATSQPEVDRRLRMLREHGHVSKFEHAIIGHNLRPDELQAAVLRIKLRTLDAANERRRALARRYALRLAGSPVGVLLPRAGCEPVHHVFAIRAPQRDALAAHLESRGVATGIHYRIPIHRQKALLDHPHRCTDMPETERAAGELLSLPMYPELSEAQLDYVADQLLDFYAGSRAGRA